MVRNPKSQPEVGQSGVEPVLRNPGAPVVCSPLSLGPPGQNGSSSCSQLSLPVRLLELGLHSFIDRVPNRQLA